MRSIFFGFIFLMLCFFSCKTNNRVTPYEYALLSAHVYNDGTKTLPSKFESFIQYEEKEKSFGDHLGSFISNLDIDKVVSLSKEEEKDGLIGYLAMKAIAGGGYYGQAYIDRNTNQLIIAHRGTDNLINTFQEGAENDTKLGTRLLTMVRDLDDDYEIFSGKIPLEQFKEAKSFTSKVKKAYLKEFGEEPLIVHTGHSLGAVLAELCAVESDSKAITFESPGTAPLMKELDEISYGEFDYKKFNPKKANVTSYNTEPNSINTLHQHIGTVVHLYEESKTQKAYSNDYLFENISTHCIDSLLQRFNPKTGKPKPSKN